MNKLKVYKFIVNRKKNDTVCRVGGVTPLMAQHLHDDTVDGLENEGVHHGLQAKLKPESGDPLG